MGEVGSFKNGLSFDERVRESGKFITAHPGVVPVIIERYPNANLPALGKKKIAVPGEMTVGQFVYTLRKTLKLDSEKALFVFVQNTLPQTASRMDSVYNTYKDEDGFLYVCYTTEKAFG